MTNFVKTTGGGASEPALREILYGRGAPQGAPTAYTGTAHTPTPAEMLGRLITSTSASAVTITMPTGAVMEAALSDMAVDSAFDWTVINTGSSSGAVTFAPAATGHTIVGGLTLAISASATLRTRKTAAGTYVTYRIA